MAWPSRILAGKRYRGGFPGHGSPRNREADQLAYREAALAETSAAIQGSIMAIIGLDHIQIAMPPRREGDARALYGALLEFSEVPKPAHLAARGGCWFKSAGDATSGSR